MWCIQVPTGCFVARRNGKIFITGNSGFPKSLSISKAIDKAAGATRQKIGKKPYKLRKSDNTIPANSYGVLGGFGEGTYIEGEITAPATPEAAKWDGWGTALKPSHEPIILARKPISEKNIAQNVLKWGTGGLWIDGCRIGNELVKTQGGDKFPNLYGKYNTCNESFHRGRFPANLLLTHSPECTDDNCVEDCPIRMLDEQSGVSKSQGGASRFFYTAKANQDERWLHCHTCNKAAPMREWHRHKDHETTTHPTQKPLDLMEWLIKLLCPPNGIVYDPFCGTGTTPIATHNQGHKWITTERDKTYHALAQARIKHNTQNPLDQWLSDP